MVTVVDASVPLMVNVRLQWSEPGEVWFQQMKGGVCRLDSGRYGAPRFFGRNQVGCERSTMRDDSDTPAKEADHALCPAARHSVARARPCAKDCEGRSEGHPGRMGG